MNGSFQGQVGPWQWKHLKLALFINLIRGRKSHITGRSIHNQKIERLRHDVKRNVFEDFQTKFCAMEDDPRINLDPDNKKHLYALNCFPSYNQLTYVIIQTSLK